MGGQTEFIWKERFTPSKGQEKHAAVYRPGKVGCGKLTTGIWTDLAS